MDPLFQDITDDWMDKVKVANQIIREAYPDKVTVCMVCGQPLGNEVQAHGQCDELAAIDEDRFQQEED